MPRRTEFDVPFDWGSPLGTPVPPAATPPPPVQPTVAPPPPAPVSKTPVTKPKPLAKKQPVITRTPVTPVTAKPKVKPAPAMYRYNPAISAYANKLREAAFNKRLAANQTTGKV